ncbi:hypothetical protein EX895_001844 [Sporisorium graminicola]|uniref:Protein kinase domain-containing protein n=1 Tax=Sporisorium graminicola TaxID=280036 RepID=A0A4U7KXA8_9BASI|nr:hypothetical protein EX895_001844 [Sporisorium graminicola]TKY89313.1 hypothetical protein EX895_001844 [Sporisorium graminicola]
MVNASRTRTALSPVLQNHSVDDCSATLIGKSGPPTAVLSTADSKRRSGLRAKLAHVSSSLLRSPSLANHASGFIELPLIHASPFASMHMAKARAGLKRKKGARDQLGRLSQNAKHNGQHAESVIASEQPPPRGRRNKSLNVVTSPHLPRDKPLSSASEHSDWSSVLSVSPTTSRTPSSRTEDAATVVMPSRPKIQTRRSSRNSLHKTLDGMTLEDSLSGRLSRSQSRSMSRKNSNHTAVDPNESAFPPASHRVLTLRSAAPDSDPSSEASVDMDDEEAEQTRLISSAPTWQLHRLRRDELLQLCTSAGAWDVAPTDDELELLTKQDLVNQIVTCRSRLDHSQSEDCEASSSSRRKPRPGRTSQHSYDQRSSEVLGNQADEDDDGLWMGSSARRSSHRVARTSHRSSPSNSADGHETDLTDASNEAGGEETEAEPNHMLSSSQRHNGRVPHVRLKPYTEGTLRRMDSSTFDDFEPSKSNQAPRRALRDKATLRDAALGRRQRLANGSEALSASTSSSVFGGRGSRASNASPSPFVHRHQLNVFVASSPVRTRSRTARLTIGLPTRRKTGARSAGVGGSDALFPAAAADPMATPKLGNRRPQRTKKSVKFNAALPSQDSAQDEDEWMEDLSSDSEAVALALHPASVTSLQDSYELNSLRNASNRGSSRRTLRTRRSTADSNASLTLHQPRSRSTSMDAISSDDRLEVLVREQDHDADMATDDDEDAPTPTKFRKLRNGKLRLVAGASNGACEVHPACDGQQDDVDMESASESAERADNSGEDLGRDQRTASPESDRAPSESIESSMNQPTFATLSRLRKSELEQLCLHHDIQTEQDDKKANLIKKLLDWHQLAELDAGKHAIELDIGDEESEDADEARSDVSNTTATARDDDFKAGQRTPTRRRNTRAASNTHPAATDSDQPLLLRARGKVVSSEKLLTPPLTSNNAEANAPQAGDGVDELNGLDLESLNLTDKEIPPSKLEKLEKIGSGGFKDVYVGKYRISKTRVNKVAIADIRDQLTEMDIKELSLLRDLRHENIVRFIGVSIPEDPRHVPCMIVSELCSNGDLFDYIRNTAAPSDAEVFRILLETARGLEYLHTRTPAIIHRDCKSTNVLITRRKTAKINDFGLARVKNTSRSMMRSLVGTVNWQAVELWVPKPHYNEKVDVWSAAMTFWEALQWHQPEKKYPFQGMNEHQIYQDVGQKRQRPYTGFIRRQFGGEIVDLLDRMWDQTPRNRPSMSEVCTELESLIQLKKEEEAAAAGATGTSTRSKAS